MATNTQVLNTFKSYLGEGGSRAWKYCGMSGGAWCCAEVSVVFANAGAKDLWFGKQTYCPTAIKLCNANMAMIPPYLSMGGDVIFFDWQPNGVPDHIGMVVSKIDTDKISTIEGNTGSPAKVRYKTRPVKYVLGIYRPLFKPSEADKNVALVVDGDFGWQSIYGLQRALKITADGQLGKGTVKALQKKAGVSADGAWGKATSKAVQKMVGTTVDGAFGKNSVIALQKWINVQNGSSPEPTPSVKGYDGTFPTLPTAVEKEAVRLAYAYGTSKSAYKYKGGKPKETYKAALNKVYPNRSSWSKQCQAGASCDVFVGTVVRSCGENKDMPRGLSGQHPFLTKYFNRVSSFRSGDIITRSSHIAVACSMKGVMYMINAHHDTLGGTYGMTERKSGTFTKYFRPKKQSYFSKGDKFTEVKYLQAFLNWFGGYGLDTDCDFGKDTEAAVKDFQSRCGLTVDGAFGSECLAMAKTIKK